MFTFKFVFSVCAVRTSIANPRLRYAFTIVASKLAFGTLIITDAFVAVARPRAVDAHAILAVFVEEASNGEFLSVMRARTTSHSNAVAVMKNFTGAAEATLDAFRMTIFWDCQIMVLASVWTLTAACLVFHAIVTLHRAKIIRSPQYMIAGSCALLGECRYHGAQTLTITATIAST